MNDDRLTDELARRVMGWKVTPDRFVTQGRSWLPKWRFAPLRRLEDAFQLLDHAASEYLLATVDGHPFTVEVRVHGRNGKASGELKARAITLALAYALGVEIPDEMSTAVLSGRERSRRRNDVA